ncbi:DUF6247 family protein [Streptomyces botrytidirepellens]|uniref:Uncharacterized protein n=1 Tax=Streptomyces botrytidirepellens TaxID=2486417 RepID=A0A3M8VV59_9ACTN|nr:DUF6247 family protein [Streptomyces botrytidirepellens]RNG21634.1 hypothetical protein EEJ42_22285 [Streptomyces botrytidirepellens]
MSEAVADRNGPLVPQPKATAEEVRAALVRIAPSRVAAFDADRTKAMAAAREHVDAAPMRRFLRQWALTVAIERHPARAARLRELEARAAQVEDPAEARAIAAEVSAIQTEAADEAGIDRRAGG